MIRRVADLVAAGRLKIAKGDGVLVKAPKDGQDLRVDMPAIGPDTLRNVAAGRLVGHWRCGPGGCWSATATRLGQLADQSRPLRRGRGLIAAPSGSPSLRARPPAMRSRCASSQAFRERLGDATSSSRGVGGQGLIEQGWCRSFRRPISR